MKSSKGTFQEYTKTQSQTNYFERSTCNEEDAISSHQGSQYSAKSHGHDQETAKHALSNRS